MTQKSGGFAWAVMLRLAVRDAGLRPAEFWSLTPAEFGLIIGIDEVQKPLNRARLAELEALYADKMGGN